MPNLERRPEIPHWSHIRASRFGVTYVKLKIMTRSPMNRNRISRPAILLALVCAAVSANARSAERGTKRGAISVGVAADASVS